MLWQITKTVSAGDIIKLYYYTTAAGTITITPTVATNIVSDIPSAYLSVSQVMYTQVGPTGPSGL